MEQIWTWDKEIFYFINSRLSSPFFDVFFWLFTSLGLGWVQAILIFSAGYWLRLKSIILNGILALILSGVLVHLFKQFLVQRFRPSNLPDAIIARDEILYLGSFPSGHTTTSFAIATAITLSWRGKKSNCALILFGCATLVGISRVYRGLHWPTDVLAGAFLGFLSGCIAYWVIQAIRQK